METIETEKMTDTNINVEEQLEDILSKISGVGNVDVMITWKNSGEKIVEKDENETVYYETNTGQMPYVRKEIYPEVEGVVVIAQGGDKMLIKQNLMEVICALFHVEKHKIKIMKGE